jgi:hypothetical protein
MFCGSGSKIRIIFLEGGSGEQVFMQGEQMTACFKQGLSDSLEYVERHEKRYRAKSGRTGETIKAGL